MNERLAELHVRIARRRRRRRAALGSAAAAVLAVAGLATVRLGAEEDDGSVATVSTSSTTTTTAPVTRLRVPSEGVVLDLEGGGAALVGLDGAEVARLPGFSLGNPHATGTTAGPQVLSEDTPDIERRFYLLDEQGVRELPVVDHRVVEPLAYGAELVSTVGMAPGSTGARRDGKEVLGPGNGISAAVRISHDRDVVSRETYEVGKSGNRAFDLRSLRVTDLPADCDVADRHGTRRYLACRDEIRAGVDTDTSPPRLFAGIGGEGWWEKVIVSPDGSRLLLQWMTDWNKPMAYTATSDGRELVVALGDRVSYALGWTADGRTVVASDEGVHVGATLVYALPDGSKVGAAAMWSPTLR